MIHRDDMPDKLLEKLEELFPGMKILFAGDQPEGSLSFETKRAIAGLQQMADLSSKTGKCIHCGKSMAEKFYKDGKWDLEPGWTRVGHIGEGGMPYYLCPSCETSPSGTMPGGIHWVDVEVHDEADQGGGEDA